MITLHAEVVGLAILVHANLPLAVLGRITAGGAGTDGDLADLLKVIEVIYEGGVVVLCDIVLNHLVNATIILVLLPEFPNASREKGDIFHPLDRD